MRAIWPLFLAATFAFSSLAHASPVPNWMRQCVRTFHQGGTCSEGVVSFNNTTNTYGIDVDNDGTDDFTFDATGISVPRVANPCYTFGDSDTTDNDDNAQICVQCTDTGSGTEDCDLTISQQVAGAMTDVFVFDADGLGSNLIPLKYVRTDVTASLTDNHFQVGLTSSRGPLLVPRAGTARALSCILYGGHSGTITTPARTDVTCTDPCYTIELYIDETDATDTDCTMNDNIGTCNVALDGTSTFSAGSRLALGVTTPADISITTYDLYCTLWVTLD